MKNTEMRLIDANVLKWKLGQVRLYVPWLCFGKTAISKILESYRRAVFKEIDNASTVDAAPVVHAHWAYCPRKVYAEDGSYTLAMDTSCSKCNWHIPEGMDSPFCPRCGARMDENIFATED